MTGMPMEYEIVWGGDPEDVLVTTSGQATTDELHAMTRSALADPRYRRGLKILVDHTATTLAELSASDVQRRADLLVAEGPNFSLHRVAFVTGQTVDYGVGRMLQGWVEGRLDIESRVFRSVDEARDWLRSA